MHHAQMRVESFADRRSDRIVWKDRQWEWAALRFEDGDFNTPAYADLDTRDKWFYQAIGASPAMFRRKAGFGSLYWLETGQGDDRRAEDGWHREGMFEVLFRLYGPEKPFFGKTWILSDIERSSLSERDERLLP